MWMNGVHRCPRLSSQFKYGGPEVVYLYTVTSSTIHIHFLLNLDDIRLHAFWFSPTYPWIIFTLVKYMDLMCLLLLIEDLYLSAIRQACLLVETNTIKRHGIMIRVEYLLKKYIDIILGPIPNIIRKTCTIVQRIEESTIWTRMNFACLIRIWNLKWELSWFSIVDWIKQFSIQSNNRWSFIELELCARRPN